MALILKASTTGILDGTDFDDLILIGTANNATINALKGNDVVVVNYSLNSTIDGGKGNDLLTVLASGPGTTTMVGGTGNDTLISGSGQYKMYGDAGNLIGPFPIVAFFDPGLFGTDQEVIISAPPTGFGDDVLIAKSNSGVYMSGDAGIINNQLIFMTAQTGANQYQSMLFQLTNSPLGFGNDTLIGGSGNDILHGDADTASGFSLHPSSTPGATAIADGMNSDARAIVYVDKNAFLMGIDKIYGGDGNDRINGDVSVDAKEVAVGLATATNGGQALSVLTTAEDLVLYGNDELSGGNGNDIIYGDGELNSHIASGGVATADGVGSVAVVFDTVGIDVLDRVTRVPQRDISGNDTVYGDAGDDTLYGDHYIYYNEANGGTAFAINGGEATSVYLVEGTIIKNGDDVLFGGAGKDKIVGDVLITELEIGTEGSAIAMGAGSVATATVEFLDFSQTMGDDTISGGDGNDMIVADCLEYELAYSGLSVSTVSGHIRIADSNNNSIIWGNDLITLGSGNDMVITTVALTTDASNTMVAQGNDVIKDFNLAKDILTFVGTDMSTLMSHTSLTYSGPDTILNFDGGAGGSITLQNVHVNSMGSLNINVLSDASTLIGLFPQ